MYTLSRKTCNSLEICVKTQAANDIQLQSDVKLCGTLDYFVIQAEPRR